MKTMKVGFAMIAALAAALSSATPASADEANPILESLRLPETPAREGSVLESLRLSLPPAQQQAPTPAGIDLANEFALSCLMPGGDSDAVENALKARGAIPFPDGVFEPDAGQPGLRGYQVQDRGVYSVIFDGASHCTVSATLDAVDEPRTIARTEELMLARLKGARAEERFGSGITTIAAFDVDIGFGAMTRISLYKAVEAGQAESIFISRRVVGAERPGE